MLIVYRKRENKININKKSNPTWTEAPLWPEACEEISNSPSLRIREALCGQLENAGMKLGCTQLLRMVNG
jgi:hypothetical protein